MILVYFFIPLATVIAAWLIIPKVDDRGNASVYTHKYMLGVAAVILAANLLVVGIGYGIGLSKNYSLERINYKVIKIEHQEQWTTHETRTETYSDSEGNSHTRTVHYTQKHGPYWYEYYEVGGSGQIKQSTYDKWKAVWNNEQHTGTKRGTSAGFRDCKDGKTFQCNWLGTFDTMYPSHSIRWYKNKIRASDSVFRRSNMLDKSVKYPRPVDNKLGCIVSYDGSYSPSEAEELWMDRLNAELGPVYQVHCLIIAFNADKATLAVVDDVLNYWGGTNKNELVVFVGIDSAKKVVWARTESWMDNTEIHSRIDAGVVGTVFSPCEVGRVLQQEVPQHWKRKEFRDFDYIQSNVSLTCAMWIMAVQIISNAAGLIVLFNTTRQQNLNK